MGSLQLAFGAAISKQVGGRRGSLRALATLVALTLAGATLMALATTARAAYEPQGTFGSAASLKGPISVAVDDQNGASYVASPFLPGTENEPGLVVSFDATGAATGGLRSGKMVTSVAMRQSTGHLYAFDANSTGLGEGHITIFDRSGTQVGGPTPLEGTTNVGQIAVDDQTGNVYVPIVFGGNSVEIFDTTGDNVGSITGSGEHAVSEPTGVAVDGSGNVYIVDVFSSSGGRLLKFDSAGNFVDVISEGKGEVSVAVDQSNGNVFVGALAEPESVSGFHVIAYDSSGAEIDDFGAGEFAAESLFGVHNQLTVDSATGAVYAVDSGSNLVRVFAEPQPPVAVTGSASSLAQATATLEGQVNPSGYEVTDCAFAYGEAGGSLSETVACEQTVGDGTAPVNVSAEISGLEPNTEYEFQLTATNAGGEDEGDVESFSTLPNAPSVSGAAGTAGGQTAATVKATVDANGGEASCVVQWGTSTAYGSQAPCDPATIDGDGGTPVSASLSGLAAGTTYHFRVVATNAGGSGQATGSFTTEAAPTGGGGSGGGTATPPTTTPVDNSGARAACVKKAGKTAKKSIKAANKKVAKAKGKKAKAKAKKAAAKAKKAAKKKKAAAIKRCGA